MRKIFDMKSLNKFFSGFLLKAVLIIIALSMHTNKALVRVAFDVGSGGLKATVAKINPVTQSIDTIYYSDEVPVLFKQDMEISGFI